MYDACSVCIDSIYIICFHIDIMQVLVGTLVLLGEQYDGVFLCRAFCQSTFVCFRVPPLMIASHGLYRYNLSVQLHPTLTYGRRRAASNGGVCACEPYV